MKQTCSRTIIERHQTICVADTSMVWLFFPIFIVLSPWPSGLFLWVLVPSDVNLGPVTPTHRRVMRNRRARTSIGHTPLKQLHWVLGLLFLLVGSGNLLQQLGVWFVLGNAQLDGIHLQWWYKGLSASQACCLFPDVLAALCSPLSSLVGKGSLTVPLIIWCVSSAASAA